MAQDLNVNITEQNISAKIEGAIINNCDTFIDLTDTPTTYIGNGDKFVKVNTAEDGLEFVTSSVVATSVSYNDLLDLPTLYTSSDFDADFSGKSTTDLIEGTNLYYTDERAQDSIGSILSNEFNYDAVTPTISLNYSNISHTSLSDIGTNTHAQIDTDLLRLADTSGTNTGDQDLSSFGDLNNGTAQGQMSFWDATASKWTYTETSELFWDDTNKRVGIGTATPTEKLSVDGRITEQGTFAEIHCHDNSTAQTIPTGATYTKVTAFDNDGFSSNCTPDSANDKITITKTGIYRVEGAFSFASGTNNVEVFGSAFLDGVEQDQIHWTRKVGTAGDVGNANFSGFIDVTTAPLDLDFRVRHDQAGSVNLTFSYANLNVSYLGET